MKQVTRPAKAKKSTGIDSLESKNLPMHPSLIKLFGYCFTKSALHLRKRLSDEMARAGVELPQFGVMMILHADGPKNQIRLGEELAVDKATMVKFLDALEAAGFVRRKPGETDRRVKLVELTTKGRNQIPKMLKIREEIESWFLSSLTKSEAAELRRLVLKLASGSNINPKK